MVRARRDDCCGAEEREETREIEGQEISARVAEGLHGPACYGQGRSGLGNVSRKIRDRVSDVIVGHGKNRQPVIEPLQPHGPHVVNGRKIGGIYNRGNHGDPGPPLAQ